MKKQNENIIVIRKISPPIVGVPSFPLCASTYSKTVCDALNFFAAKITNGEIATEIARQLKKQIK